MAGVLNHPLAQRVIRVPPAYYVFAVLLIILAIAKPNMLNVNVLGIFIRQVVPLGVLVLGQLLVMRVRSIDLSGGGIILLVNYFISSGMFPSASLAFFVTLALVTGTLIGLFNGLMVGKRRASAVIVTLAVSIILVGLVQFLSSGRPPGDVPTMFADIYNTKWGLVPTPVLFWVVLTLIMALFLSRSVFGRFVASVGENAVAAHFSGVPVARTVILAANGAEGLQPVPDRAGVAYIGRFDGSQKVRELLGTPGQERPRRHAAAAAPSIASPSAPSSSCRARRSISRSTTRSPRTPPRSRPA